MTAEQCVNTATNAAGAVNETTFKASVSKKCVTVAKDTECLDDAREVAGTVTDKVQTRNKTTSKCELAAIADVKKCFDVTAQALADVSKDKRRGTDSRCFTLKATECFEKDAAVATSATVLRHSETADCVNRKDGQCFETNAAVKTSATKALKVSDGTCLVLKATECNNNGAAKVASAD